MEIKETKTIELTIRRDDICYLVIEQLYKSGKITEYQYQNFNYDLISFEDGTILPITATVTL